MKELRGWMAIWVFVAAYDAWAGVANQPTLSKVYRDAARAHPLVCGAGTAYMVGHLWGLVPRRFDPLCRYSDAWSARRDSNAQPAA